MGERYTDYDSFAWIYNQHWGGFSKVAAPVLDELLLNRLPAGALVLDVACGTGHVSRLLQERGFHVTGFDGSEEMLCYARQNAPGGEFFAVDARDFTLPPLFHGAVSTFDSLNHILKLEELERAFANIHAVLRPGGGFAFDLNMEPGYVSGWNGHWGDSAEDHAYIWKNSYDPETKLGRFDATLFRLLDGEWRRSDLTLYQKAYTLDEISGALSRAGFVDAKGYQIGEQKLLVPVTEEARRGFFVAWKG